MEVLALHIAKLELKAGQVLCVKVDGRIDAETATMLKMQVESYLPDGVSCMVFDEKITLQVLDASEAAAH
jgi:alpha-D-ribose 1-methylphosphonate 5-triphosphate synthase subunit PhnL